MGRSDISALVTGGSVQWSRCKAAGEVADAACNALETSVIVLQCQRTITALLRPAWQDQLLQACRNTCVMWGVELCCNAPVSSACRCLQGALVMPLMSRGFKKGVVKFNLITAQKPLE